MSHNCDDLSSVIRLVKEDRITENELLKGTKYKAEADDLIEEMEAVKYFLWLNIGAIWSLFCQPARLGRRGNRNLGLARSRPTVVRVKVIVDVTPRVSSECATETH